MSNTWVVVSCISKYLWLTACCYTSHCLQGPEDLRAYKYNETKTLTWLESKVHKVAKALKDKNIHVSSGAVSATFIASNASSDSVDQGNSY